jgi:23S rRNA (adenine-N6)-dimethyltransferase
VAVRQRPARGAPGQHFLRSSQLASELVREASVAPDDLVVDVGAGTGVLTTALVQAGARVIALELDSALASRLRRRFGAHRGVTVLESDASFFAWPREPFAVVANLPFAGSGQILSRLLRDPGVPLCRADVIVQWELATKQVAVWPTTLKSTYWKAWFDLSITTRLARNAFSPAPGVDAAVLRVERRSLPLLPTEEHEPYWHFLADAFRTQAPVRRSLRQRLSPGEVKRLAPVLGFSPDARARDIDARQWARLFAFARERPRRR